MTTPHELAHQLEAYPVLPEGTEERFNGYGLMGMPFSSGHVLALRRFTASSIGNGYTSVWHRNPAKIWTFYADTDPQHSCTRYFGRMATQAIVAPISVNWLSDFSFEVVVESAQLYWSVKVAATPVTKAMNVLGTVLPQFAWKNELVLSLMSKVAGAALGVQRVGLSGTVPNGQHFIANPKKIWAVTDSHATLAGADLGTPTPLHQQASLQDFWIPQKGILAFGQAYFEAFNANRHLAITHKAA